jgi:superfamily II DNA or RNA helicase
VAAALARALLPAESDAEPPVWLRSDQRLSFRRAMAAVERHGGALLADGVGTGKTWIGLAVARALEPGKPIHVIAPAALIAQWHTAAARAGLPIISHSHETLSRGRAPSRASGPLLIDESHRFRSPGTARYATLAPWCVGRRGLLLSATPVVNRLEDLASQLLLLIRDDALAWAGTGSIRRALERRTQAAPATLAELVVTGEDRTGELPARREITLRPEPAAGLSGVLAALGTLRLSSDPPTAGLLRVVLLRALASSPAALAESLRRYRKLLQHAADAAGSGRMLGREAIRRFVGADADQLVLWPVVAAESGPVDLALEDRDRLLAVEAAALALAEAEDPKLKVLAGLLAARKPALVFTGAVATVGYLRDRIELRRVAWLTGSRSGLDRCGVPREQVLDWFRKRTLPTDPVLARPELLIATDVAAEGLDLPLIRQVIHYDLPWTAVRLEQRSGRAIRLGSTHSHVVVARLSPPANLEALLRQEAILDLKAGMPAQLGLDTGADAPWRLRARLAAHWQGRRGRPGVARVGVARVGGSEPGIVAGLRIVLEDQSERFVVLARRADGWTDDLRTIGALLQCAEGRGASSEAPAAASLRLAVRAMARRARITLQAIHGTALGAGSASRAARQLRRRLLALVPAAARARSTGQLDLIGRGLALVRRGHTAGEAQRLAAWAQLPTAALMAALAGLPAAAPAAVAVALELVGILIVEPDT